MKKETKNVYPHPAKNKKYAVSMKRVPYKKK